MSFEEVVVEKSPFFRLLRSRGCFFFSSSEKDKHIRISAGTQLREKYVGEWDVAVESGAPKVSLLDLLLL